MHVDASPTAPRSVAGLSPSPTRQDVENAIRKRRLPKKVDWLDPTVVWGTAKKHFYSHLVSSYADTRPIQAFIDQAASRDTSTTSPMFGPLSETSEDMWIDFVADIGDGFDATYAIAYLIAQESLHLSDVPDLQLQAGQALIMGGDLAYPDATKSNYNDRCLVPYGWANPEFSRNGPRNPQRHLYCVAGNHDWYD